MESLTLVRVAVLKTVKDLESPLGVRIPLAPLVLAYIPLVTMLVNTGPGLQPSRDDHRENSCTLL